MTKKLELSGKALIDVITLENSLRIFDEYSYGFLQFHSLANLIESIILYDELYLDKESYEKSFLIKLHGGFSSLHKKLPTFIKPLASKDEDYDAADSVADAFITSVDQVYIFSTVQKLYPDLQRELSVSSGYWRGEGDLKETFFHSERKLQKHYLSLPRSYGCSVADSAARAWFYLGLSMRKKIMYIPNDFRAIFISYGFKKRSSAETLIKKLEKIFSKKAENNAKWFNESYADKSLRFPLIFNHILTKARKPDDIFPIALDIRNSKSARSFRKICYELDEARKSGEVKKTSSIIKEMNEELQRIKDNISIKSNFEITVSFPPSLSFNTKTIRNLGKSRHCIFLRKVFNGARDPRFINEHIERVFGYNY